MSAAALEELRAKEYALRREVARLRRLVYDQSDPTASPELSDALARAEQALLDAEQERSGAQKASVEGVILDTRTESRLLGADTTGLEARVELLMEFVPTAIAHLLKPEDNPLVRCWVKNATADRTRRLRVIASVEGYAPPAVETVELEPLTEHVFELLPVFDRESTRPLNELTRATLTVLAEDLDGNVELNRSIPIWLLARTCAPLAIRDLSSGEWRDMTPYFGAFVTPNTPEVMRFTRQAAEHHPQKMLAGYQGEHDEVEAQVGAIFDALKSDANITYVNSVIAFSPDEGSATQRVRLPRESLEEGQANCIDGTVLFASLLEAVSLSAAIVVVPGHAFVGWETWDESDDWHYVETTMINAHTFEEASESAAKTANRYAGVAGGNTRQFRRWPLRTLRSSMRITPME
jgi:hypothetical protein